MSTRPQPLAALDRALASARTPVVQSWTSQGRTAQRATRHIAVTAASLAMAGLLGACASPQGSAQHQASGKDAAPIIGQASAQSQAAPSQAQPAPSSTASAKDKSDLPIVGALKNAETAVADYARARRQEATLREALQAANDAALVARHRSTIGAGDFMLSMDAEKRLQLAQRNLSAGEAYTRATRERMYRAFGLSSGEKLGDSGTLQQVSTPAPKAATARNL